MSRKLNSDSATPEQGASNHAEAIEALFREHNQRLLRFLTSKLASAQEAREVAQEAYVRLLQLDQPSAIGYLQAFLYKTANNLATDRLRHRSTVRAAEKKEFFDFRTFAPPEVGLAAQQDLDVLSAAMTELSPKCQQAFVMSRFRGMGTQEIARRMGLQPRQIRSYLAQALAHCRKRLDRAHEPERGAS